MVRSVRWSAGSILESYRINIQLHISPLWFCNPTHRLCKVSPNLFVIIIKLYLVFCVRVCFNRVETIMNSNIYYINDKLDKRTWTYIFGACCATTVFIPSFHNYRIWSFLGLGMTTYTAWYLTIAALVHGQVEGVTHSAPTKPVLYFTGATNILYTFGGHAVTV